MALFTKKDEDYNTELQNAVEDWIQAGEFKRGMIMNKIKKYAKQKLKKENGFSEGQLQLLDDVTSHLRGAKILNYDPETLRLMHLHHDEYQDQVRERLITTGVPVVFPKVDKHITNNAGVGAIGGGLLLGIGGAIVGGALGASDQQIREKMVYGEKGIIKVADKGIVLSNGIENVRIPWKEIKGMKGLRIELVEGQHIIFYDIHNKEIIESEVNSRITSVDDGW